ncbi:MAG: nuclear transport factor 2 family protein, partial [Gammaproteobacteria bacterium]
MNSEEQIRALLDKQTITEVIHRYARAIDRFDESMLRSVFHPGSQHAHFFEGPSSDPSIPSKPGAPGDFVAFAFDVLRTHLRTHHQLGNTLIELDGDQAFAETYFTAYHRMRPLGDPL